MIGRRNFLALGAAAAAGGVLAPTSVFAGSGPRKVTLLNAHSGETCSAEYCVDGWYNPDVLGELDYILRDWRTGEQIAMDPELLDILFDLQQLTGGNKPIYVVSGYRSPKTNAALASASNGVARNSFHLYGKAADIFVPDYDLAGLRDHALKLGRGGVGYYPSSNFVHVDTGPVRHW